MHIEKITVIWDLVRFDSSFPLLLYWIPRLDYELILLVFFLQVSIPSSNILQYVCVDVLLYASFCFKKQNKKNFTWLKWLIYPVTSIFQLKTSEKKKKTFWNQHYNYNSKGLSGNYKHKYELLIPNMSYNVTNEKVTKEVMVLQDAYNLINVKSG